MKHILVPIGSSENASNTLQYAIDLATVVKAKVFVFRAYKVVSKAGTIINMNEILARETALYLRSIVKSIDTKNVETKIISAKGGAIESIEAIDKELGIDLIAVGPKSNSIKDEVFLGATSGSIVRKTEIPILVVPEAYKFSPFKVSLTAFKSGVLRDSSRLNMLKKFKEVFGIKTNLLLVKTPDYKEEDLVLDKALKEIGDSLTMTENMTTFQGVLEHFQTHNPDLLCVFRRKRGFFQNLWKSNTILKSEFHCTVPLLVLGS